MAAGISIPDKKKEQEFERDVHRRDIADIESIMDRAVHAYKFAQLESRWSGHLRQNGITEKEERMQWLRQKYIEENDLEEQKEEAKLSIEEMIE